MHEQSEQLQKLKELMRAVRGETESKKATSHTIRIGDVFNVACFIGGITGVAVAGEPVVVDATGRLGVAPAGTPLSMNELLKERRVMQELKATTEKQQATIAELKSTVAQQQKGMEILTAQLEQQSAQIQKVSAQLELSNPAPQTVKNNR